MTAVEVAPGVLSWASEIDGETIRQAAKTARLPVVSGHIALMPDAHVGIGATVGSVIATKNAIIPAAVGVDIGCGMIATETALTAADLPDSLDALMPLVEARIPAGVGQGHDRAQSAAAALMEAAPRKYSQRQESVAWKQLGSLGSGNHFVEVCLDERDFVWTVLHSGSRGVGNQLATEHIKIAQLLMQENNIHLEDRDLAYFLDGQPEYNAYISDMLWAQRWALRNRELMNDVLLTSLRDVTGTLAASALQVINCHHNFTIRERHNGQDVWVTRKGAIKAQTGDLGVIPGSMGTRSYIVRGLGNPASYDSCAHGAGRRMSRGQARRELTPASLTALMDGKTWNASRAGSLVDEHPSAYKDIDQVMEDQRDLVEVRHTLRQIFNYKG